MEKYKPKMYNSKIFPMNREWKNNLENQFIFLKINTSVFRVFNPDGLHYFRVSHSNKTKQKP